MHYVYILKSGFDSKLYIGYTENLKRRIKEHKSGQVISTSKRLPIKLIMYEAYLLEADARAREKFFKTTKGKLQLKKQLSNFYKRN